MADKEEAYSPWHFATKQTPCHTDTDNNHTDESDTDTRRPDLTELLRKVSLRVTL
jgi:hypothetical protein